MSRYIPKCSFVITWIFILIAVDKANAQSEINFTSLTVKEGLSSNTVNAIVKDRYGLMWFGTANGLSKFDGSNFTVYRHDPDKVNSLPANEILSVYEDHSGRIWIGTSGGGISFYDRKSDCFIAFRGDGSWPTINKIAVRAITQDHFGRIWTGTYHDLRMLDPKTGQITQLHIDGLDEIGSAISVILSLFEDSQHRMWVGTNNGLYLFNWKTNKFTRFAHQENDPNSLSNDVIKTITEDSNRNLWIGTNDGLNQYGSSGNFFSFRHNNNTLNSLSNSTVFSLCAEKNGVLWVGTEDGLNIYDPVANAFIRIGPNPRNVFSPKSKSVRSIFIDAHGIFWVGTYGGGISKYDKNLALFNLKQSDPFDPSGLKSPMVTAFAGFVNNQIFIGMDGGGIELFNRNTGLFKSFPIQSKLKTSGNGLSILSLLLDRKKRLWAGTYHNGLFCIDTQTGKYEQFVADGTSKGPCQNNISSLMEDSRGEIWIGTLGNGVDIYNTTTHQFRQLNGNTTQHTERPHLPVNQYISSMIEAPDGSIWMGSIGTGIFVFKPQTQTLTHYSKEDYELADDVVQTLMVTRSGVLWAGTNNGLSCFNDKTKKFISYKEKQGLGNNFVKAIVEDNHGALWLSTDRGISIFNPAEKTFRNFTAENGVQQSSFAAGAGIKVENGDIYFGGQDGFNFFNPSKLPLGLAPGPVVLTDLKVSNESVQPGDNSPLHEQIGIAKEIRLNYGQNFSISYVALDYTSPKQNQYAYKLSGFDNDWNFVHKNRTANYTNIDPGTYVFQIKASNDGRNWNNPLTEITVIVMPPFWRTGYAYGCYVISIVWLLLFLRARGIKKLRTKFEVEQEKIKVKQLIEQERREAERLHELDLLKIKFLTDISHEFRTPISLILAPVEKLLENKLSDDIAADIRMIYRNVKRLLNMVNQLLDFRKMEENELKLNPVPNDIISFVTETAESFKDIAAKKHITLHIEHERYSWNVLFDHDKLERVIFNLLSNAFKFTQNGGTVNLVTSVCVENALQPSFIITVADTGIGVATQDLQKIFERFYQPKQTNQILNQGTGIGLSITKEFVELHGGKIRAVRLPEAGTKFIVELPLVPVLDINGPDLSDKPIREVFNESQAPEIMQTAIADISVKLPTVILVEDNEEFRCYLAKHLKQYYHIIEATNGKEGWQKTLGNHPQLVVSDINMPEMNGIELSRKIKADKRTSHIPVILLTAFTGEEEQLKGLKSGANDYLTKPFNFQILDARISNLLDLNRSLKDTYSKHIQMTTEQIVTESADVKLLNCIVKFIEDKISDTDLSVEELSKHVGMSRGSLYYKLIELTGLSPVEYIRAIKLDKAANLLETSNYNVAQIAYMTGFGTPSYFSRSFKSKFNVLPSEYIGMKRNIAKAKINLADVSVP